MQSRLSKFFMSAVLAMLIFIVPGAARAQRRPAADEAPSVTYKTPPGAKAGDYVGPQTCAGCHRAEAEEFFKTVHAQAGEAVPSAPAPAKGETPAVAAGRKIYDAMMCAGCHQIGGQGGTSAPALDDVGARRTRAELMDRMLKRRAGTIMPTLPKDMSDKKISDLVDYMMTLKGQTQAVKPVAAAPPVVSGCEACHGPGRAHADAEQAAAGDPAKMAAGEKLIFAFNGNPKENSERCLTCHESGKQQEGFGHSMHMAAGVSCQDCHSPHLLEAAGNPHGVKLVPAQSAFFQVPTLPEEDRWLHNSLLKKAQPQLCYQCHQTIAAQFALPEHHRVPEGFMKCTDCHNPHGSMNHFNLNASNWESCVKCHVEKRGPYLYEHPAVRVEGCVACHNPHGSVNNFLLIRREQRLLCLQCHTVVHTSPSVSGWNGQANVPHGRGGYQTSGDCTRCHAAIHGSNFDQYFLR